MSLLKDILYKVSLIATAGDMKVDINKIEFDSRQVGPGDLFVAIKGTQSDGHDFIHNAIEKGAIVIVCEQFPEHMPAHVTFIKVPDSAIPSAPLYSSGTSAQPMPPRVLPNTVFPDS